MPIPWSYHQDDLVGGGVRLADLADRHGTPLYVYHRPSIASRVAEVREAFEAHPTRLCYSVKANSNLRLLKWLAGLGVGFDVVSEGELDRLAEVGVAFDRVVFAGVGKTLRELERAAGAGLWMVNVESVEEAQRLNGLAAARGIRAPISLRLNPDVDARTHRHITTGRKVDKFGIALDELPPLLDRIAGSTGLDLVGLHMHLGSQITDTAPYDAGLEVLLDCGRAARAAGVAVRWINAGGGFGISYDGDPVPRPEAYAEAIVPRVREFGAEIVLELGRYLVGPAGCLLTRVLYRKERDGRSLAVVDAGMTDLMRPALYEARHRIWPLRRRDGERATDVAGPICESSDFLGRDRPLPPLEPGDLLAVLDTGAYGMAMSSHYNSHPRAAEVWITEDGSVETIRRRETSQDLMAVEREAL
ncbi:MAG TPA: diaminopimelate decarboxylase [Gemmatimonadota bacterium]|nr:diaminopimelate decarboxylase [Gemmatimonadota bacterium]